MGLNVCYAKNPWQCQVQQLASCERSPNSYLQATGLWILIFAIQLISLQFILCHVTSYLYNKRVCPAKNEPQQQGISYLESERERGLGGQFSRQSYLRLGLGEIEGRYRD